MMSSNESPPQAMKLMLFCRALLPSSRALASFVPQYYPLLASLYIKNRKLRQIMIKYPQSHLKNDPHNVLKHAELSFMGKVGHKSLWGEYQLMVGFDGNSYQIKKL